MVDNYEIDMINIFTSKKKGMCSR